MTTQQNYIGISSINNEFDSLVSQFFGTERVWHTILNIECLNIKLNIECLNTYMQSWIASGSKSEVAKANEPDLRARGWAI